jgi:GDPmannose 4,6-dehydratase
MTPPMTSPNPNYTHAAPATPLGSRGWSSLIPGISLVLGLYLIAAVIIFSPEQSQGRAASDQFSYHEPSIRKIAADLPSPDLADYWSATTPGYHLLLSLPVRALDPPREALMLAAAGFTAGLYLLLSTWLARRVGPGRALWLTLPLLTSVYTLFPAVWLLPDNAGWLLVTALYLLALRPRFDRTTLLTGGTCLLALVWVRQSHLWAAAPLLAAAWLGTTNHPTGPAAHAQALPDDPPAKPLAQIATLFQTRLWGKNSVASRLALTALAILPAALTVAWFARLWGGLTPPRFQDQYGDASGGIEPATPAFFLSVTGLFIPFMWGYVWPGFRRLCKTPALPITIALAALALALIPETFPASPGRRSGIWHLAAAAPILFNHTSLLIALLTPLGALGLASMLATVPRRTRPMERASAPRRADHKGNGITGQDGTPTAPACYLAGVPDRQGLRGPRHHPPLQSSFNTDRIDHLYLDPHIKGGRLKLHYGDLCDANNLSKLMESVKPTRCTTSAPRAMSACPSTCPSTPPRPSPWARYKLLEAVREFQEKHGHQVRYYQASSSEQYGKVMEVPQKETTPFYPRSPYAVREGRRALDHGELPRVLRHARLLRHPVQPREPPPRRDVRDPQDHPRRGPHQDGPPGQGLPGQPRQQARLGLRGRLREMMWMMLQQDEPDDYVIATGQGRSPSASSRSWPSSTRG